VLGIFGQVIGSKISRMNIIFSFGTIWPKC